MAKKSKKGEEFGLGELPPSAVNQLGISHSFTKDAFLRDLKRVSQLIKTKPSPKLSKT
jgi:hypothetical protein